jgi:subtilisin family serine protease
MSKASLALIQISDVSTPLYKEGRLLVKTVSPSAEDPLAHIASHISARMLSSYSLVPGLRLYEFDKNVVIEEAIDIFNASGLVEYAEPDYYLKVAVNDPRFSELWALENTGQSGGLVDADINATSMWAIEDGSDNIVIGIIDTGIDYNHSDLSANMWRNSLEIANNNIDDDNNGYIDDVFGINAITNVGNPFDDHSHGTHVAGTIGAQGNNALGVVGVAQKVKVAGCKFLAASGSGTTADAIECLQYFANLKTRSTSPVNIVATNNSWGSTTHTAALQDAIKAHQGLGILFVAASGNSSTDTDSTPFYPANYELSNVISVAATDRSDNLAYFSNFGNRTVHISAPGSAILSTIPNQGYASYDGTSMAAPHVSGLAAIIKARFPTYNYKQIKNLIIASGTPIAAAKNKTISGRRIRGADTNGTGSLTCTNQIVRKRIKPFENTITVDKAQGIFLSALHINCHQPAGSITVFNSAAEQIILKDTGINGDAIVSDGVYSTHWYPRNTGTYILNYGNGDTVTANVVSSILRYRAMQLSASYESITGSSLLASDESTHKVITPFPIRFNNDPVGFSTIYVGANGTISFETALNPGFNNTTLPTTKAYTLIAAFWDDLIPSGAPNSNIYIATTGSAPNRKFIVEWRNMKNYNAVGEGTFQTVFFEGNSNVVINYADTNFDNVSFNWGASATIGIQTNQAVATQYSYNVASVLSPVTILFRLE